MRIHKALVVSVLVVALSACGHWQAPERGRFDDSDVVAVQEEKRLVRVTMADESEYVFFVRGFEDGHLLGESRRRGSVRLDMDKIEKVEILNREGHLGEGTVVGTAAGIVGVSLLLGFLAIVVALSAIT